MAKCVWCGRRKKLFETFNKYGFCPECKLRVREDIKDKMADVEQFISSYKSKLIKVPDDELCKLLENHLSALDELEELRERVPMFKSSTEHLRRGLLSVKQQLDERLQTAQVTLDPALPTNLSDIELSNTVYRDRQIVQPIPLIPPDAFEQLKQIGVELISIKISSDPEEQISAYESLTFEEIKLNTLRETYKGYSDFQIKAAPYQNEINNLRKVLKRKADERIFDDLLSKIERIEAIVSLENVVIRPQTEMPNVKFTNVVKRSNRETLGNFTVVDIETTGLDCYKNAITEVSAIKFRGFEPQEVYSSLIDPHQKIPFEITKLTGIDNFMVSGKPLFAEIVFSLQNFIGKDTIIGHNLIFDLRFLFANGLDLFSIKRRYYDTCSVAKRALPSYRIVYKENGHYYRDYSIARVKNYKLGTLCDYYKIYRSISHRSESDCLATGLLFKELVDQILES